MGDKQRDKIQCNNANNVMKTTKREREREKKKERERERAIKCDP